MFDIVSMIDVLEHIGEWTREAQKDAAIRLLSQVAKLVKPGGYVFIAVPNKYFPLEMHTHIPFLTYVPTRVRNAVIRTFEPVLPLLRRGRGLGTSKKPWITTVETYGMGEIEHMLGSLGIEVVERSIVFTVWLGKSRRHDILGSILRAIETIADRTFLRRLLGTDMLILGRVSKALIPPRT
jgi:SAM-dependent methyltransferase